MRSVLSKVAVGFAALAVACASSGQMSADGVSRLERARASRPNDPAVARSLGIAYYKADRYPEARAQLDRAVRLDPRDGTAVLYLGLTAEKQNDVPAARAAYQGYVRHGRTSRIRRQLEARLAALTRQELRLVAKASVAQEQRLSSQPGSPLTVAVMPLRFVGVDSSLQPLERGFAELIITDLSRSKQLQVVERARIQALLDEITLQQSGQTDSATNVRAGRIIQAGRIVNGQIAQLANEERLRVDAAIVNTQTSAVTGGAASENTMAQLFALQKAIVRQLFDSLGVRLTTAERDAIEQRPTRSMQAFLAYSRGLGFEDRGMYNEATRAYQEAVRIDPSFGQAQLKSVQTANAAQGQSMTAASVEATLVGTPEGAIAQQSGEGQAPSASGGGENGAGSVADGLNPSSAGVATAAAGAAGGTLSTTLPPPKDPLAAGSGTEQSTSSARVIIGVKLPRP